MEKVEAEKSLIVRSPGLRLFVSLVGTMLFMNGAFYALGPAGFLMAAGLVAMLLAFFAQLEAVVLEKLGC